MNGLAVFIGALLILALLILALLILALLDAFGSGDGPSLPR